jgi:RNA polymerase sigma-70 factor (ECF subfamily)
VYQGRDPSPEPPDPDAALERALVERARAGDDAAYEVLVRRHQEIAFRTAWVVTRSAQDAEDVAQDAFLKAYRALGRFRPEAPFRPWLLRIVANEARNWVRSRMRRAGLAERAARTEGWTGQSAGDPTAASVEDEVLAAERRSAVRQGLERLPERDRVVITCRYFLGLSEAETAAALDCPPGTVKSRLSRALGRLRDELGTEAR